MLKIIPAILIFSSAVMAQTALDPHDLSGHWNRTSATQSFSNVPSGGRGRGQATAQESPLTAEGKKQLDANMPGYGPRASIVRNDPLTRCAPLGLVRNINAEVAAPHSTFEILQVPGRVLQFFEYHHDWREIWMDGRKLPSLDDVDNKWNGYSVGRWEGDTLVVESLGFDPRSWLDKFGYPHSDEMRVVERYRRVDADTLEVTMTITDPSIYSKPWSSDRKLFKLNRARAKEWDEQIYCVPDDEFSFNELIQYNKK